MGTKSLWGDWSLVQCFLVYEPEEETCSDISSDFHLCPQQCVIQIVYFSLCVFVYRGGLASGLIDQLSDVRQIPAQCFSQHAQRLYPVHQTLCTMLRLLQLTLRLIGWAHRKQEMLPLDKSFCSVLLYKLISNKSRWLTCSMCVSHQLVGRPHCVVGVFHHCRRILQLLPESVQALQRLLQAGACCCSLKLSLLQQHWRTWRKTTIDTSIYQYIHKFID